MEQALSYAQLKNTLQAFDAVCFSLWDTLIARCVLQPEDIYTIAEKRAEDAAGFAGHRIRAGKIARERFGAGVSLSRIGQVLEEEFGYSPARSQRLLEAEFQTELDAAAPRTAMVQLARELARQGKRILICCDSPFGSSQLRAILEKCGLDTDTELWVSCEHDTGKASGGLWTQLLAALEPGQTFVHVGSDPETDIQPLERLGRNAIRITGGMEAYLASEMAAYLRPYHSGDPARSLFLGYFIQCACFNAPFSDVPQADDATAIWLGAPLVCLTDALVRARDDSLLLFVTREGYLLRPMYQNYCAAMGVEQQDNVLFYASRSACLAAMAVTEKDFSQVLQFAYTGTLGHLLQTRFNYALPQSDSLYAEPVTLPQDARRAKTLLQPRLPEILAGCREQQEAYRQYVRQVNPKNKPMTVVDVGYSGTIQYALSRILGQKLGGQYLYLTEKELPGTIGCDIRCVRRTREGDCPIFDNLLFLEAAMQVPCGQLQQMALENGTVAPRFNRDANMSDHIPVAQEQYLRFARWAGRWKGILGDAFRPDFSLAEALWVILLKYDRLPRALPDSFWLADDFAGTPLWRYDPETQLWTGSGKSAALVFTLRKAGDQPPFRQRLKGWVKKNIPRSLYARAQHIWNRYLR